MHLKKSSVTERRLIGKDDSDPNQIPNPIHHHHQTQNKNRTAIDNKGSGFTKYNHPQGQNHHHTVDIPTGVDHFRRRSARARSGSISSFFPSNLLSSLSSYRPVIARFLRKLLRYTLRARLICFHLRFLLLLAVPPLYIFFLVINLRIFLRLVFVIIALSFILSISLRFALPHLTSIRQYRLGLRHGIGVYTFYTGDVYAGEWSNGQCHGCGVYTSEDGSRYDGEFKWGVKHGLGSYHFRNGDAYAGEYFADKMHGFGVYHFANGHKYEGAWHEGRRQGLGMYTFRNGDTQAGHWEDGVLSCPTEQTIRPGSSFTISHSKVVDAVEQARKAAEKAHEVVKVEERIKRAVMAANRAANAARVAAVKAVQSQTFHRNDGDLETNC